ncbi:MAG: DUF1810 domain-containing protein [Rhodobacteraceae bacterium]|nr:DUF1810 domain-containing protein [Paracoccaceae bacterium]
MAWQRAEQFLDAQDRVWTQVVAELTAGRKTGHWMWFVFPQLAALGRSQTAQRFGLSGPDEAAAYLGDARLRARLVQAARLVLTHPGKDAADILGSIDALKLRSSMTLFSAVPGADPAFGQVIDSFYDGVPCPLTRAELGRG